MNRLNGLDALRGIAALLVLAQHLLFLLARDLPWAGSILSAVDLGALGVAIFFLISGFVIPFSLHNGLAAFGVSRVARLLPALWLSIMVAIVLGANVEGPGQLLANAFMIGNLVGQENFIGSYWTLTWELQFYCIAAALFAVGALKMPRAFGLLSLMVGLIGSLYHAAASHLIIMFCGALLRMVLLDKNEAAKMWLRVSITMLVGVWYLWFLVDEHPLRYFLSMSLAFPAFLLLWNRFSHPVLLWLGSVSYSLYLFHLPILQTLDRAGLPPLVFAALGAALPLFVAGIVFRWVERPMIAFGKTISRGPSHQRSNTAIGETKAI